MFEVSDSRALFVQVSDTKALLGNMGTTTWLNLGTALTVRETR